MNQILTDYALRMDALRPISTGSDTLGCVPTMVHILLFYSSWAEEQNEFFEALDLDPVYRFYNAVVRTALDFSHWTALVNFCETMMRKKEIAKREYRALERQQALLYPLQMLTIRCK